MGIGLSKGRNVGLVRNVLTDAGRACPALNEGDRLIPHALPTPGTRGTNSVGIRKRSVQTCRAPRSGFSGDLIDERQALNRDLPLRAWSASKR
jgi:hypothetical protein